MAQLFKQIEWDDALEHDCRALARFALREDLGESGDRTTLAIVSPDRLGVAQVVAREPGVLAGQHAIDIVLREASADVVWTPIVTDGDQFGAGDSLGRLEGNARDMLSCERVVLNLLGRMCGIATLASRYTAEVEGTGAAVLDTRKTTPGWRRLEKYAVRCGGGTNHRMGLHDAILIKDNHLALAAEEGLGPDAAVSQAREAAASLVVEVEVDTLEQLEIVLPAGPDVVLLDNMSNDQLREAVARRDRLAPDVLLEASGGVRLETIGAIALTGVDHISVGALTHSAIALDVGLDWAVSPKGG